MTRRIFIALTILAGAAFAQSGIPTITTGQYDTGRTGANLNEILLNPSNVNVNQFGKLFSWPVDGWIFAQPLYVPGVQISGTNRNVVYVATMHNSVYAFNADSSNATPLWHVNLGTSVPPSTFHGCPEAGSQPNAGTGPELGILSTPVIDPSSNTMYVVAATPSSNYYVHYLHALDITTGKDKTTPVKIQASVSGTGYDNQNGTVSLTPSTDVQRTALLLANGGVYAGFGNCGPDTDPWHGWVVGYSTANINNQTTVFNSTPNGGQGGIWQSGRGLVADASGKIYFTTGNATVYNSNDSRVTTGNGGSDAQDGDYPMRFVQLLSNGQFGGSYPPPNYPILNSHDLDFSSSGPLLIPGTNLIVAGGKDGIIYLFDPGNVANPLQSFQATGTTACSDSTFDGCNQIHGLAFWNNTLYVWGGNDILRAYAFNTSTNRFNTSPASQNTNYTVGYYAPPMAVSANSTQEGILWSVNANSIVHAFNASNVANELWNSNQNANRDGLPSFPKFAEPTVANGRVYVASHSNQVAVYGLLSDFTLSSSVQSETMNQGSSGNFSLTVTSLSNSSSPATFSVSGLPSGATASFSPSSVTGSGSSTVTINTASSTPTGTYNLIVSATRGGVTRSTSVSLVVTVSSDTTPPQWTCCTYTQNGSSITLTFTAWDTQSGMKSIQAVQVVNATVSIPPFPVGTHAHINFTATESGTTSYVKFKLTDVAGNVAFIDPAFLDPEREAGKPIPFPVKYVTAEDGGIVTIQNLTPGLKNVRLEIGNGLEDQKIEVAGLKDGETRVVDITQYLPGDTSAASVTVTPLGKPGGAALFIFGNMAMTGSQ